MKVSDDLYVLELPLEMGGNTHMMNLSLIVDSPSDLTLVDTGLPGQAKLIEAAIEAEGFKLSDVKRIIITHQDLDHVGSLHELKNLAEAQVLAYEDEIAYIDGTLPLVKTPSPERLAAMPDFAAIWKMFTPTEVDLSLSDGEVLHWAGGIRVVATPGHTPGHMSLFLEKTKTLIAGDCTSSHEGKLLGPNQGATPDMEEAMESLKKLVELDIKTIVCYHGGLVTDNPNEQLKNLVA